MLACFVFKVTLSKKILHKTDATYCHCKLENSAEKVMGMICIVLHVYLYAAASADDQSKPSIDAVAVERDTVLRQVTLCYLLDIVDLSFLDGIANHTGSEQVGWPSNTCCNGLKLTYENPLFASVRLDFYSSLLFDKFHYQCNC